MKITRCKSCLFKADSDDGICPVCGIVQDKAAKDLTKEEKKIRSAARGIRAVSVLHVLCGIIMLVILPMMLLAKYSHGLWQPQYPAQLLAILAYYWILGPVLLVLSVGLKKYAKWAYYTTAGSYGIILAMNLIYPNFGLLVVILCTYYIWNERARAIFNRSVTSSNKASEAISETAPSAAPEAPQR